MEKALTGCGDLDKESTRATILRTYKQVRTLKNRQLGLKTKINSKNNLWLNNANLFLTVSNSTLHLGSL